MAANPFEFDTRKTWIGRKLSEGDEGRAEVNHHIMSLYGEPLRVYYLGTSFRGISDPHEVVQGFFADRLSRESFLRDWHKSGIRLRRWLMTGFCLFLKEFYRQHRGRDARVELREEDLSLESPPEADLDREFARSVVRRALERTEEVCEREGFQVHWQVFHRHFYEDSPYSAFAAEIGVTSERAAVMVRSVSRRFKRFVREFLSRDGMTEDEIDREIEILLEVTGG